MKKRRIGLFVIRPHKNFRDPKMVLGALRGGVLAVVKYHFFCRKFFICLESLSSAGKFPYYLFIATQSLSFQLFCLNLLINPLLRKGSKWELFACDRCGSDWIHIECGLINIKRKKLDITHSKLHRKDLVEF